MATIKITLVRSINSATKKHVATVKALGLTKIGQTVERQEDPAILGMVRHVAHLVSVEKA